MVCAEVFVAAAVAAVLVVATEIPPAAELPSGSAGIPVYKTDAISGDKNASSYWNSNAEKANTTPCQQAGGTCIKKKYKKCCKGKIERKYKCANRKELCCIIGCPIAQGYTMFPGSQRCFKLFLDDNRDWYQAMTKCRDEKLIMAKTTDQDAVIIREGLVNQYGDSGAYVWLDAKYNGAQYVWNDGELIAKDNELWYPGQPELKPDYCLVLLTGKWYMNDQPLSPYWSGPCLELPFRKAFCELDLSKPSV